MSIRYTSTTQDVTASDLEGFFVGWPNPPSPRTHLELLQSGDAVELAVDDESGRVVGFVTGLTDHRFALHITFLEVRPAYQHRGIGTELMRRLLKRFDHVYGVSVQCDEAVRPFYARLGLRAVPGMGLWRYARQSGE